MRGISRDIQNRQNVSYQDTGGCRPGGNEPERPLGCFSGRRRWFSKSDCCPRIVAGSRNLEVRMFDEEVDKEAVTKKLHSCKESLVTCEKTAKRVRSYIDKVIRDVSANGISTDNSGRALNPFPQVPDLDSDCGTFLIQANRAIKHICELPQFFLSLERADSNFDHLSKRLEKTIGKNTTY